MPFFSPKIALQTAITFLSNTCGVRTKWNLVIHFLVMRHQKIVQLTIEAKHKQFFLLPPALRYNFEELIDTNQSVERKC